MEDNKSTQQKENYTLQPLKEVNVLKDWIPNTKQTALNSNKTRIFGEVCGREEVSTKKPRTIQGMPAMS